MTDCARCGRCCEDIWIQYAPGELEKFYEDYPPSSKFVENADFILENWTPEHAGAQGGYVYQCKQFNKETRECNAHDSRPPVCRDFPWYGKEPDELVKYESGEFLRPQCSFNADVRTMLPIVEVR